jgi:hypothetical protein
LTIKGKFTQVCTSHGVSGPLEQGGKEWAHELSFTTTYIYQRHNVFLKKPLSANKKILSTWSDKATDKNNLWFVAIDLEDSRRFAEAAEFYIKDAIFSWQNRSYARAALSCACTANCLEKISDLKRARRLHYESASIYEMHAHQIFNKSVREAIWALERAYQGYLQAQRKDKAEEILRKHKSLAAKVNLFSTVDISTSGASITDGPFIQTHACYDNSNNNTGLLDSEQLVQHIDLFLKIRSSSMDESGKNDNVNSKGLLNLHVKKMQPYWNQSY